MAKTHNKRKSESRTRKQKSVQTKDPGTTKDKWTIFKELTTIRLITAFFALTAALTVSNTPARVPQFMLSRGIRAFVVFSSLCVFSALLYNLVGHISFPKWSENKRIVITKRMIAINVTSNCISILHLLLRLGFIDYLAASVSNHFPSIKTWASQSLSWVLAAMLSGMIGNLFYDLLKWAVLGRRKL